jgi:hypothetical protein
MQITLTQRMIGFRVCIHRLSEPGKTIQNNTRTRHSKNRSLLKVRENSNRPPKEKGPSTKLVPNSTKEQ